MKKGLIIIMLAGLATSCNLFFEEPPPSIDDPRIIAKATKRIKDYTDQKQVSCINRINRDAEIHVDSTITNLIDQYLTNGTYFPPKPQRPDLPKRLELDTSLKPIPIFKDSLPLRLKRKKDSTLTKIDTSG